MSLFKYFLKFSLRTVVKKARITVFKYFLEIFDPKKRKTRVDSYQNVFKKLKL